MQLILDEVHELQSEWEQEGEEWAEAGVINSSKVLIVTVSTRLLRMGRWQRLGLMVCDRERKRPLCRSSSGCSSSALQTQ